RSSAQPAGLLLLMHEVTSVAAGGFCSRSASEPPAMRARLTYCVPLVALVALTISENLLLPPAGIETIDEQVTPCVSAAPTRKQPQSAAFAPPTVSEAGQVSPAGRSSRKKIPPTDAASPLLVMVKV